MLNEKPIEELFQELFESLESWGFSLHSKRSYNYEGVRLIRSYYNDAGITVYNEHLMEQIVSDVLCKRKDGIIPEGLCNGVLKIASHLRNYSDGFQWGRKQKNPKLQLSSKYYSDLLERYREYEFALGLRGAERIKGDVAYIRYFFYWLEQNNKSTLTQISLKIVSDYLVAFSKENPCTITAMLGALRKLHSFLERTGIKSIDISPALTAKPAKRKKLMPVFSQSEADGILSSVDTDTSLGKRNYAMLMIAKELGVRVSDIISLKLSDICWETHEIKFKQSKTDAENILPLEPEVGNAIADYILHGRPETKDTHIFVRSRAPFVKLTSAANIIKKYVPRDKHEKYSGFHSFRRGLLSKLLNAGVSADVAKSIAGHTKIDSLKPYSRISAVRLKSCAMGLAGIEPSAGVLQ